MGILAISAGCLCGGGEGFDFREIVILFQTVPISLTFLTFGLPDFRVEDGLENKENPARRTGFNIEAFVLFGFFDEDCQV